MNVVHNWCLKSRLTVNREKTKIVHFRKPRQKRSEFLFTYGSDTLEIVQKYKYLGVVLNEFLDFNVTAEVLAGAGGRALGSVISKFRQFKNTTFSCFTKLIEASVNPVLDYGSEVWGFKNQIKTERVQQRAARYYLGVHPKTPIPAINGDIGWNIPLHRRYVKMIKFWNRVVNMTDQRLTKQVFLVDKMFCKDNWCSEIKWLFDKTEMNSNFDMVEIDVNNFETKIAEYFNKKWKDSLLTKPKLRTYMTYKNCLESEEYVKHCLSRRKRSLLAQFRMGVLPIAIETGRFKNEPVENRICQLCNSNTVEDEKHLLVLVYYIMTLEKHCTIM